MIWAPKTDKCWTSDRDNSQPCKPEKACTRDAKTTLKRKVRKNNAKTTLKLHNINRTKDHVADCRSPGLVI